MLSTPRPTVTWSAASGPIDDDIIGAIGFRLLSASPILHVFRSFCFPVGLNEQFKHNNYDEQTRRCNNRYSHTHKLTPSHTLNTHRYTYDIIINITLPKL